jgi:hypothetical protein
MSFMFHPLVRKVSISNEREDGQMPGPLDGLRKQALMRRADSADSPRQYLSPFGNKMAEELSVFEINVSDFFRAKLAHSLAPNTKPSLTWHFSQPFCGGGSDVLGRSPMKNS